jgi:predicted transcriptional regulator
MLQERHTGYPVEEDGDVVGVVTLSDAREVDEVERDAFTVRDVMSTDLLTIDADQNAMAAIQEMQRHGVGRLVVLDGGAMAGLVSRSDVMTAFNIIQSRGTFDTRAVTGGSDPDTSIDGTAVGRDGLP